MKAKYRKWALPLAAAAAAVVVVAYVAVRTRPEEPKFAAELVDFETAEGVRGRVLMLRTENREPLLITDVHLNGEARARVADQGTHVRWSRPWSHDRVDGKLLAPGRDRLVIWLYADDPPAPNVPKWKDYRGPVSFVTVTVEGRPQPVRVPVPAAPTTRVAPPVEGGDE